MRGYVERPNVIRNAACGNSGQTQFSKEFPMGEGWYTLFLRFNLALTVGTGTTPLTEGELLYIKNVLVRTDKGEIICNLPGRALFKIAATKAGALPRKDAIAAATATYRVSLPIHLADFGMLRPEDTILDASRYNSVSMQITLGGVADLLGTPGTATVATTLDVELVRSMGRLPDAGKPIAVINYDSRPPVDANVTQFIELERSSDMSIKRLYVHSGTSGTGGVHWSGANSDAVQDIVSVRDQSRFIEAERVHAQVQDLNKLDHQLEAVIAGVEIFDFVRDKSLLSALATGDKSLLRYQWTNQGGVGANSIVTATQESIRTLQR